MPKTLSTLEQELLILIRGQRIYGLELLTQINAAREQCGITLLKVGSLYPTLQRLEQAALIRSDWDYRHKRRYYELSELGQETLQRMETYRAILKTHNPIAPHSPSNPSG